MKHRSKKRLHPDLTPLIDVVFLLLIFFLVSSMFKKKETALNLSLPVVEKEETIASNSQIQIELKEEILAINGKIINWNELDTILNSNLDRKIPVLVKVDKTTDYEWIAKLLDRLQINKYSNLQFIEQKE